MAGRKTPSRSVQLSSEPYFDKSCAICHKSDKREEATSTCLDCKNTLCGKCLQDHNKFDIMKGHRVVDKAISIKSPVSLPTKMCERHGGKLVDMYCPQHDQVCCSACIPTHHRRCVDLGYVPSISAGIKTSPELQNVLHGIQTTLTQLQQRKTERDNDKKRIADEKIQADKNIKESAKQIIDAVNEMKQKSLDAVQGQFKEFQGKIDDDLRRLNDAIAMLEGYAKGLQSLKHENDSQVFVVMKQGNTQRELSDSLDLETGELLKREALYFNVDHEIVEKIQKAEMLGTLETPFTMHSELGKYNVKLKDDKKQCYIKGICTLTDGKILLADLENESLKRLDAAYKVLDHCILPGRPASICLTGPNEVAVCLGKQKTIQFVSLTDTMTPTGSFSVGKVCRGVAYSRGQLFVTCGGDDGEGDGEVRVFNTRGRLCHKIPQQTTDKFAWSCPMKIGLSPDATKMLVSDLKHGLVIMDRDGSKVHIPSIKASCMCGLDRCLWFTTVENFKTIYQVTHDGCALGPLLTEDDGIDNIVTTIFYQKPGDKMIVGLRGSDNIKVFNLHRK